MLCPAPRGSLRPIVLALSMLAVLAGCTVAVPGTARPAPAGPAAATAPTYRPTADQQPLLDVFARARSWDLCALHDLAAAARVTRYQPDELYPYLRAGNCRLALHEPGGGSQIELTLDVRPLIDVIGGGGAPIDIGGVRLEQVGDNSAVACEYSLPLGEGEGQRWGLELSVYNIDRDPPPCTIARDYATALLPRLQSPPPRAAGATTPALSLSASDPCAVAGVLAPVIAGDETIGQEDVEFSHLAPVECTVVVRHNDTLKTVGRAEVAFVASTDEFAETVAGRPALVRQLGESCELSLAPDYVVLTPNPGLPPVREAVRITGDCAQLPRLGEAALTALVPPSAAPAAPDAVALGDLDPPPTSESVGAPFDPCAVAGGWAAYPEQARASTTPIPLAPGPDSGFKIGCKYNAGEMFSSLVWGPRDGAFSADPADRPGSRAATFGGRPGVEETSSLDDPDGPERQVCYSAVQLSTGLAAMSTSRPGDDPCAINRAVLERVVQEVP